MVVRLARGGEAGVTERELALAVIQQAMNDACELRVIDRRTPEREPVEGARGAVVGASGAGSHSLQAWNFLTEHAGEWAQSRALWADAAGVLPAAVRDEALRRGPNRTVRFLLARKRAAA